MASEEGFLFSLKNSSKLTLIPGQRHRAVKCQTEACPVFGDGNLGVNLSSGNVFSNLGSAANVYQLSLSWNSLQLESNVFLQRGLNSAKISNMEVLYISGNVNQN